jgi:deazaflavin-dependent oxidoreductase (nitroreductase family)
VSLPRVDPDAPPTLAKRAIVAFSFTKAGQWFVKEVSRRLDPILLRLTGGRVSTLVFTPVVMLTTRGAKSGLERTTPLLYFNDGDRVVVMASNYGGKRHPAWYHNVSANPEVTLSARGEIGRYVGRKTSGAERERLWERAKQLAATYGRYEESAGSREIPVIVFERA